MIFRKFFALKAGTFFYDICQINATIKSMKLLCDCNMSNDHGILSRRFAGLRVIMMIITGDFFLLPSFLECVLHEIDENHIFTSLLLDFVRILSLVCVGARKSI